MDEDHDKGLAEGGSDADWEGERRGDRRIWFTVASLLVVGCAVTALSGLLHGPRAAVIVSACWLAVAGVPFWAVLRRRNKLAGAIGVAGWQLPLVTRSIQQERVPRDPGARRAMGLLIERQRTSSSRSLRLWPVLAAMFLANTVLQWTEGRTWLAVISLCGAVPTSMMYLVHRRVSDRLDRVAARLGSDAVGTR